MIPKNEVHILFCQTPHLLPPAVLNNLSNILSKNELNKANRYRLHTDRQQSILSRYLLRIACSHYLGSSAPEEWVFDTGEKGKPYLSNGHQPLHFNVSHTHNLIALALSQHYAIGVDVEHTLRNSDTINIADRYFSCHELEELHALPIAQQENHFFDYWTLKESYIKACGVGLSIPLDSFSFHVDRSTDSLINSNVRLTFREDRNDQTDHWHSSLLQLGDVHRGALSIHTLDKLPSQAMSIRCFIAQNTMHNMTPFIETSLPLPTANSTR